MRLDLGVALLEKNVKNRKIKKPTTHPTSGTEIDTLTMTNHYRGLFGGAGKSNI